MSAGDTVQFKLTNQRVDKKDLVDMQDLPLEALQRALGGLLGKTSGAVTKVEGTFDSITQTLTLGPCVLYWGNDGILGKDLVDTPLRGGVVIHDPDRPAQNGNSTVDLTGFTTGRLFFRRRTADADYDNRAFYPSPGSGEQVATTATRLREWVEFAVTTTTDSITYNSTEGWYHFANFQNYTTFVRILTITPFGERDNQVSGSRDGTVGQLWASDPAIQELSPTPVEFDLANLLHTITMKLLLLEDSQVTVNVPEHKVTANPNSTRFWRDIERAGPDAYRGIRQLSADITDVEADIAQLQTDTSNLRTDIFDAIRANLAAQAQILATCNVYQVGELGEGTTITQPFVGLSVSTEDVVPRRTWKFHISCSGTRLVYNGQITVSPHQILAVRAVPFHTEVWSATNRGRVADVQVYTDAGCTTIANLPVTVPQGGSLYAKVRFRKVTVDDNALVNTIEEPDYGFYVEVIGRPVF